jgi:hypothetical protein
MIPAASPPGALVLDASGSQDPDSQAPTASLEFQWAACFEDAARGTTPSLPSTSVAPPTPLVAC